MTASLPGSRPKGGAPPLPDPTPTCPEADTTLLWAYGEAPASHAAHVAACVACRRILAEHEAVATALGPALAALRSADPPGDLRSATVPRRSRAPVIGALALAAAALVAALVWSIPPRVVPEPEPEPMMFGQTDDPIEAALDDLDLEVLDLELELL